MRAMRMIALALTVLFAATPLVMSGQELETFVDPMTDVRRAIIRFDVRSEAQPGETIIFGYFAYECPAEDGKGLQLGMGYGPGATAQFAWPDSVEVRFDSEPMEWIATPGVAAVLLRKMAPHHDTLLLRMNLSRDGQKLFRINLERFAELLPQARAWCVGNDPDVARVQPVPPARSSQAAQQ